jgi:predicted PurR-regulated permease PerM
MIVLSVLVILLPLSFLISVVVDQTQQVITHRDVILDAFEEIEERIPGINITERINNNLSKLGDSAANITVGIAQGLGNIGINIAIAYFLFYFLLIPEEKRFWKVTYSIIPFSKRHTRQLLQELTTVTNSAILTSGIIAVLQGLLVGLAFAIVGINSAVFWGFISALISFIPVIGTPLIWGPATIILFAQNNITGGIILLVAGLFLSTIDNFIRPIIQNRVGRIHPFAVLLGIFVGLNLFGILGFVVGPLLLMYFVLMMRMFKEEYLSE